jgi:hypothetical protein
VSKLEPITLGTAIGFGPFETFSLTRDSCATDAPGVGDCAITWPDGLSDSVGTAVPFSFASCSAESASSNCLPTTFGTSVFGGPVET